MDSALNNSATESARPSTFAAAVRRYSWALVELTKPKIGIAAVITAVATYVFEMGGASVFHVFALILASGMAAGGSLAFNQWWERGSDELMMRTRCRPLPQHIVSPLVALSWSIGLSIVGCLLLWVVFGVLTAGLGVATILIYAGIYTPMKRRSAWATEVGSLSGAIPPLLGAAAAGHIFSGGAWLFAIALLFWQMPHFYAIGWIYRGDYRAAKLPLLPAKDSDGRLTGLWMLVYSGALVLGILIPWSLGLVSMLNGAIALAGAIWVFVGAWKFYSETGDRIQAARRLFRISLFVLPALLFLAF